VFALAVSRAECAGYELLSIRESRIVGDVRPVQREGGVFLSRSWLPWAALEPRIHPRLNRDSSLCHIALSARSQTFSKAVTQHHNRHGRRSKEASGPF
jgi:hypothetical protein